VPEPNTSPARNGTPRDAYEITSANVQSIADVEP
jgi:hypothetical protein